MVQITYTLRLDMRDTGIVNTSLRLKQGDSGMKIAVNVFNGGVSAFDSSTTPKIVFRRPDGASVMADMTVESSLYSYTLVGNELQVPGKELIDIKFPIGAEGRESTMSCSIEVVPDTITPNTHGSGIYDNDLAELVEEATEAAETVQEVVGDSEAWADGTRGGVPVGPDDPAYHNNSKYWSEQANPTRLENLTDVDFENLTDRDILRYNSEFSEWQNSDALSVAENAIEAIFDTYGSYNLLPNGFIPNSQDGTDFTVDKNGVVTATVATQATANCWCLNYANPNLEDGKRYFFKAADASSGLSAYILATDNSQIAEDTGDGVEFTYDASKPFYRVQAGVKSGTTAGTFKYYPMIIDAKLKERVFRPHAPTNRDCMSYAVNTKLGAHNILGCTGTTQTLADVTFSVDSKGIVTTSGTSTQAAPSNRSVFQYNSRLILDSSKTYRLSGCPAGGGSTTYDVLINFNDSQGQYISNVGDEGNGVLFTPPSNASYAVVYVRCYRGVDVTGKVFKPMITVAEDTDPTYAPHAMTNRELTEGFGNVKEIRAGRFSYTNGASIAGTVTFDKPFTKGTTTVVIITGESGNTQYITLFTVHGAGTSGFSYIGKNVTGDTTSTERYAQYIAMRF